MRHTIYWERGNDAGTAPTIGERVEIEGDEASHSVKSKRLREGDACHLCDGAGVIASCAVERTSKSRLSLIVESASKIPPTTPAVEVCCATPKGQRLDKMLDMLAQCGAASWRPMGTARGVVEPGAHKLERAQRISIEALKQSGRTHLMRIEREISFADALEHDAQTRVLIAQGDGAAPGPALIEGASRVRLLIGPEGGFTTEELAMARERGARAMRLGPHVLRIETAAVLGVGAVLGGAKTGGVTTDA